MDDWQEVVVDSHMIACGVCGAIVFENKKDLHELFHNQLAVINHWAKRNTFEEMVDSDYDASVGIKPDDYFKPGGG